MHVILSVFIFYILNNVLVYYDCCNHNQHKSSKLHGLILSQLWMSEAQSRCKQVLYFLQRVRGGLVSSLFHLPIAPEFLTSQ